MSGTQLAHAREHMDNWSLILRQGDNARAPRHLMTSGFDFETVTNTHSEIFYFSGEIWVGNCSCRSCQISRLMLMGAENCNLLK